LHQQAGAPYAVRMTQTALTREVPGDGASRIGRILTDPDRIVQDLHVLQRNKWGLTAEERQELRLRALEIARTAESTRDVLSAMRVAVLMDSIDARRERTEADSRSSLDSSQATVLAAAIHGTTTGAALTALRDALTQSPLPQALPPIPSQPGACEVGPSQPPNVHQVSVGLPGQSVPERGLTPPERPETDTELVSECPIPGGQAPGTAGAGPAHAPIHPSQTAQTGACHRCYGVGYLARPGYAGVCDLCHGTGVHRPEGARDARGRREGRGEAPAS
jgi:hypothetical protein